MRWLRPSLVCTATRQSDQIPDTLPASSGRCRTGTVIPGGLGPDGLPIGVQLIGPAYGDLRTVQLARRLEQLGFGFTPPPGFD